MARFGLIGGSYQSRSSSADSEKTMNWYPEVVEAPLGKSKTILCPTPGTSLFGTAGAYGTIKGIEASGRLFVVDYNGDSNSGTFYEFASDGTYSNTHPVSGQIRSLVAGNDYVFLTTGTKAYAFKLSDNSWTDVTASLALSNPLLAFFLDGYYGVVFSGTNEFQISSLEDPTTWSGLDVAQISVFPGNIVGCLVDHRELWFWTASHAQVYYNSGNASFPLAVIAGGFIEQGIASYSSAVNMDNTVFWIGSDKRGTGVAWRADGYSPQRVSTHAEEHQWKQYPSGATDAIGWSYQDEGHTFWVLYFPSGNATWVYDAATGAWHQRALWSGAAQGASPWKWHAYCFNKQLVGSNPDGNIYELSSDYTDDHGTAIHRERISPPISTEMEWMFHKRLTVDLDLNPAPAGNTTANVTLSWSDDGGSTWSAGVSAFAGASDNKVQRVVFRRLGRSRSRMYKISVSDSVAWRIVEGYLIAEPGYKTVQRMAQYYGQME